MHYPHPRNHSTFALPYFHSTSPRNVESIAEHGLHETTNPRIVRGVYTIASEDIDRDWIDMMAEKASYALYLRKGSKLFATDTDRPFDVALGQGYSPEFKKAYSTWIGGLGVPADEVVDFYLDASNEEKFAWREKVNRRIEAWLDRKGYCGIWQGGEVVITDLSCIKRMDGPFYLKPYWNALVKRYNAWLDA